MQRLQTSQETSEGQQVEAKGKDTQPAALTIARWESFTSAVFKLADQCILASF